LALSGMLAILLRPVICFFEQKIKLGRIQSILLMYFLVILIFASSVLMLGGKIFQQTREIAGSVGD